MPALTRDLGELQHSVCTNMYQVPGCGLSCHQILKGMVTNETMGSSACCSVVLVLTALPCYR